MISVPYLPLPFGTNRRGELDVNPLYPHGIMVSSLFPPYVRVGVLDYVDPTDLEAQLDRVALAYPGYGFIAVFSPESSALAEVAIKRGWETAGICFPRQNPPARVRSWIRSPNESYAESWKASIDVLVCGNGELPDMLAAGLLEPRVYRVSP